MSIATTIKKSLVAGFLSLPVLFISYIAFLSMGLASINLFLLLLGTVTVLPLTVGILHTELPWKIPADVTLGTVLALGYGGLAAAQYPGKTFGSMFGNTNVLIQTILTVIGIVIHLITASTKIDTFGLVSGHPEQQNVVPSFWSATMVFIMGYMLSNAQAIYTMPSAEDASKSKVNNRKSKAFILMMNLVLMLVLFLGLRYALGTETVPGIGVALFVIGPLSFGWHQLTSLCGAAPGDIFGIVQRMLPATAAADVPKVCVYSK
jgi:hypothetical protein